MTDTRPSRRVLLRYCSVGLAAALAGCQGDDESDEDGNGTGTEAATGTPASTQAPADPQSGDPASYADVFQLAGDGAAPFRGWLAPDNPIGGIGGVTSICAYSSFEYAAEQELSGLLDYRSALTTRYGIEDESLHGELLVGVPDGDREGWIRLGEFDTGQLLRRFRDDDRVRLTGEYRGYSIFQQQNGSRIVVGSDAIIGVPVYEQYIDTNRGDADRLAEVDEDVETLLSVMPAGAQLAVSRHDNLDDLVINGSSRHDFTESGNPNRTTRAFLFDRPENATVERAEEIISLGNTDYEEILTTEQHRRMVMIEFIADWGED